MAALTAEGTWPSARGGGEGALVEHGQKELHAVGGEGHLSINLK